MTRARVILTGLSAVALLIVFPAAAHPIHTTTMEAEYVERGPVPGQLQVSLRLHPDALEEALSRRAGRPVVVNQAARVDRAIAAWLAEVVEVRDARGRRRPVRYVGRDVDKDGQWLFFTVALPGGLAGAQLANRAFLAVEAHQVNAVTVRDETGLVFSRLFTLTDQELARLR